ncbi:MAG: cell division protein FtsZ [Thermotogaceae bacterium]|nr:cell division protein FtsZ [Thermotogaceae bacterium]MDN5336973.1 cell division protein FtsZ [Thermotogaceae bacterium]
MAFEIYDESLIKNDEKRQPKRKPIIKVIGIGGAGNNAINRMVDAGIDGVVFVAANTDLQVLENCKADVLIPLGKDGMGAGGEPQRGEQATLESKEKIVESLEDADMLFITAGLGGGTGTGGAPVVAEIAKEMGILTVAIVTTPFYFEGNKRWKIAMEGLSKLKGRVDTLIKISNNKLLEEVDDETTTIEAFRKADETLMQGIRGISELITKRGYINLDFADINAVMRGAGTAMLGIGIGKGENRAIDAAKNAMESRLLEQPVENATAIILNISAPENVKLKEMHMAAAIIKQKCSEQADVRLGLIIDDSISDDEMRVTLIATGFEEGEKEVFQDNDIPAIYRMGLDWGED